MKSQNTTKTAFLQSLVELRTPFEVTHFTDVELDTYYSTLIYIFGHQNYSEFYPRLKQKDIDRFLFQNNHVYLIRDQKLMLANLYFLWSKGERERAKHKLQGLVVLLREIMKEFTDEEVQTLVKKITPLFKQ